MRRKRRRKVLFSVYVDPACLPRLDRIAEAYARKLPGARIGRTDAGRAAIYVGLAALERELGLGGANKGAGEKR
jgi:hypothetical protein